MTLENSLFEDNAEYGFKISIFNLIKRVLLKKELNIQSQVKWLFCPMFMFGSPSFYLNLSVNLNDSSGKSLISISVWSNIIQFYKLLFRTFFFIFKISICNFKYCLNSHI